MKIILLENIKGIGRKLDVKEVKDGYARNFLLPKGMAEAATPRALKKLIEEKSNMEKERGKLVAVLEERAEKIGKLTLFFKLKVGGKDEIFGSVNAKDVEEALNNEGVPEVKVLLEKPIKDLGEKEVKVDLGEGVKTKVKILVEKE